MLPHLPKADYVGSSSLIAYEIYVTLCNSSISNCPTCFVMKIHVLL